jgi:hypothetical protein
VAEAPPRFRRWWLIGCATPIGVILSLPFVFRGCEYWKMHRLKTEFMENRAYYESLVLRIKQDAVEQNRSYAYIIPETRESAVLTRYEGNPNHDIHSLVMSGRMASTDFRNGHIFIKIPLRVDRDLMGFPTGYGFAYSSSDQIPPLSPHEEACDRFLRIEKHWWVRSVAMAH